MRLLIRRLVGFKDVLRGMMFLCVCVCVFFAHVFIMHNGPYQTRETINKTKSC